MVCVTKCRIIHLIYCVCFFILFWQFEASVHPLLTLLCCEKQISMFFLHKQTVKLPWTHGSERAQRAWRLAAGGRNVLHVSKALRDYRSSLLQRGRKSPDMATGWAINTNWWGSNLCSSHLRVNMDVCTVTFFIYAPLWYYMRGWMY